MAAGARRGCVARDLTSVGKHTQMEWTAGLGVLSAGATLAGRGPPPAHRAIAGADRLWGARAPYCGCGFERGSVARAGPVSRRRTADGGCRSAGAAAGRRARDRAAGIPWIQRVLRELE